MRPPLFGTALAARLGNRATGEALRAVRGSPVQRWSADEHRRLGDTTGLQIDIGGGVQLSFGQVMALAGDEIGLLAGYEGQTLSSEEFETRAVPDFIAATKTAEGRAMIRAHLEKEKLGPPEHGELPEPTAQQRATATSNYVLNAMDNSTHFAGGGTAVETWIHHHARAIDLAMQAGLSADRSLLNEARLWEAFGGHFLTDAFSSGHIRVPRQAIIDHYVGEVAPKVFDNLVAWIKGYLVDRVNDQIYRQARWFSWPPVKLLRGDRRQRIRSAVNTWVSEALAEAGGRAASIRSLGLGLAGLVSGAMHDAENERGLEVISEVHPDPWKAFGDGKLDDNPKHKRQVEEAIRASVADLDTAYAIGLEEYQARYNVPDINYLPSTVYFELGTSEATPETANAAAMVGLYLRFHPATVVTLTGHTCPIGSEADNEKLSADRADTLKQLLIAQGIEPSRVATQPWGERALVTRNPKKFGRNRRVEFVFSSDASRAAEHEGNEDPVVQRAQEALLSTVGPPYRAESHFPRAAPGLNAPLPEWRWGSISGSLRVEMNKWAADQAYEHLGEVKKLKPIDVEGYTVDPREIALRLVHDLVGNPVTFLEKALAPSAEGLMERERARRSQ